MADLFKIIGHDTKRAELRALLEDKRLPQTTIFYGLDGIGKKRVALECVAIMFCANQGQSDLFAGDTLAVPCGSCDSCLKLKDGIHPDFFLITPTPPKSASKGDLQQGEYADNWTIKVEQVEEVKSKLIHYPLMAPAQVVVIDAAERMTTTTANALLKVLEEPKPNLYFILVTGKFGSVLPTLRSRSARFYFKPLDSQQLTQILSEELTDDSENVNSLDNKNVDFFIRCFGGSLSRIRRALAANLSQEFIEKLLRPAGDFLGVRERVEMLEPLGGELSILLQCLRQCCLENYLSQSAGDCSVDDMFEKISVAEKQLSKHIQKELVLENLFL